MAIKQAVLLQFTAWLCALIIVSSQRQELFQLDSSLQQKKEVGTHVRRKLSISDQPPTKQKPARFLMGIFTVEKEQKRRNLIRRALAMYHDKRICSMGSTNGALPPAPADRCELIYTFVFGANPDGPTQVLGNFSGPVITTPPEEFKDSREPNDITFLNIKVSPVRNCTVD